MQAMEHSPVPQAMPAAQSQTNLVQSLFSIRSSTAASEDGELKGKARDHDIPNGGVIAWLQVLAGFFFSFNSWGMYYLLYDMIPYYEQTFLKHRSVWAIMWIGNIQGFLLLSVAAIVGPLFDWGYSGHSHFFIGAGSFCVVIGTMMTSLCHRLYQFGLAQAVVVGFGAGCIFVPSVANIITYFDKRRALAVGIALSGGPIGGIIYTSIFQELRGHVIFPDVVRIIGFISMLTLLIALMVWKPRDIPRSERKLFDISAAKQPLFILYTIAIFVGFLSVFVPVFELPAYARLRTKISPKSATYSLSLINTGTAVGSLLFGQLADLIGPLNVMAVSTFWAGMMSFIWISVDATWRVLAFGGVFGLFAAPFIGAVAPVAIASLSNDISQIGARLGFVYGLAGCALLISNVITQGFLRHGSFLRLQVYTGFFLIGPAAIFLLARVGKIGWEVKVRA